MIGLVLAASISVTNPVASGLPWAAAQVARLRSDVDAILDDAKSLRGAHVGLLAVETASGRVLYERRSDDAFMPASTMKVVTGSAALATLGPAFTFKTALAATGDGRLVLVGGGDALLRARDLDAAAAAVAAAGLAPISGIDADTSYFEQTPYLPGWSWDDFPYKFSAVTTALCLEDNVVHATVTPAGDQGAPASLALEPDATLAIDNRVTTGAPNSKDTVDVARDGSTIVFTGSIPRGAKPERIDAAVPDPPRYAVDVFTKALAAHGVAVAADAQTEIVAQPHPPMEAVWTHESAPLARYLADMWYPSDNLIAELLLKSLGVARRGVPGTSANGLALESAWLRSLGIEPSRIDVTDGSGLSIYDRLTPRVLVRILQYDWNGPNREIVLDALPVAGVRGTLRSAFKGAPAERRVFAKDGSRRYARGLAGYLRPLHHGAITFAFLVDDWMAEDDGAMDAVRARVLSRFITAS